MNPASAGGPRRVVTLPPTVSGEDAARFAREVQGRGADLLEIRTDLHAPEAVDAAALSGVLPLLVSERGRPLPPAWVAAATWVDRDVRDGHLEAPPGKLLASHHADRPLSTAETLARWDVTLPPGSLVKHVEPLGAPSRLEELRATQDALRARFGAERVTVLAMGALALPFRAVLAARNVLDYVAAGGAWSAAPGQRLLDDAVREARAPRREDSRLAILGTSIAHSRSPEIHRQPFDRIDLPEDAPVEQLVDALRPAYAGFAVTSPFKRQLARHTSSALDAINTLVRRGDRWESHNTDIDGARAVLDALGAPEVLVLGDGGTTTALRAAARDTGRTLRVLKRADIQGPLSGAIVWTWPDRVEAPASLRFEQARVAVIAYGAPGRRIASEIELRGGTALALGEAWFDAQAQKQRALWETAT
ncbi:shikimate dehydrogenase [Myxococcaceae bacterium GXIMD 01537]